MEQLSFVGKYDAFIFDFDGTLVDSNYIKRQGFFVVTNSIGNADRILHRVLGSDNPGTRVEIFTQLIDELRRDNVETALSIEKLISDYSQYCQNRVAQAPEIACAQKMLEKLRSSNKHVFLSSATPEAELKDIIEKRSWDSLFDQIHGSPQSKREHIAEIKKVIKCESHNILMFGDVAADALVAAEAGVDFIGVGLDFPRWCRSPIAIIENFETWSKI